MDERVIVLDQSALHAIRQRRSVRAYRNEPLTDEQVQALIDAGLAAPSAMNQQPWHIIVLKNTDIRDEWERDIVQCFVDMGDPATIERIRSRNNKIFYDAPVIIVVARQGEDAGPLLDVGILVENVAIAAKSIGLDSVILGMPQAAFTGPVAQKWKEKLRFPEGYHFGIAIAVGHSVQDGTPHQPDTSKVTIIEDF